MEIIQDQNLKTLNLTKLSYIKNILQKFQMESAMACNTPMSMHTKLSTKDCPNSETDMIYMSKVPYTSVVGTIMHTMVCM